MVEWSRKREEKVLQTIGTHDDEAGSSPSKRSRQHETVEEDMFPRCVEEIEAILEIKVYKVGGQEEILVLNLGGVLLISMNQYIPSYAMSFTPLKGRVNLSRSLASTIRSPILKVLQKMITYGLCQRTIGYDKMQKNELWLMSMFEVRHQNGYANVACLMATWLKRNGVGSQRDSIICCGKLIKKLAKRIGLLTNGVLNSLSALAYCRALDGTTLRELISPNRRLIVEDPAPEVPRVAMPRGPCPSMQDLYDMKGHMEIRQEELKRMSRRQSYHSDRYAGLFENMARHYGYTLQGTYAPPGYDEVK
nr:hypothetical protein [Tanacetum cinerariifolium]